MANFTTKALILADLSDNTQIECTTTLWAQGDYHSWHEPAPCEWMYSIPMSECDIDNDTIEVLDPTEFDPESVESVPDDVYIKNIASILEVRDWELQGSIADYTEDDDYDRLVDAELSRL